MLTFMILLLTAVAVREFWLERWLGRSTRIRSIRKGWLTIELRRRVAMERLPGHVSAYPEPREERILVTRLGGLALWHSEVSVALPSSACGHLSQVTPLEFDRQFPARLRLADSTH